MAVYKIYFRSTVENDLKSIPRKDVQAIFRKIEILKENPRPIGCEKLADQDRYRIRQGNYRIIYSIQDWELTVWVVKVGNRKNIYKSK